MNVEAEVRETARTITGQATLGVGSGKQPKTHSVQLSVQLTQLLFCFSFSPPPVLSLSLLLFLSSFSIIFLPPPWCSHSLQLLLHHPPFSLLPPSSSSSFCSSPVRPRRAAAPFPLLHHSISDPVLPGTPMEYEPLITKQTNKGMCGW